MIIAYIPTAGRMNPVKVEGVDLPANAVWLDLLDPSAEQVKSVELLLKIDVPTPEEMREIEVSSRLYTEDGTDFMTLTLPHGRQATGIAHFAPVTFILTGQTLVTLRYSEPKSFEMYAAKLCRGPAAPDTPPESELHFDIGEGAGQAPGEPGAQDQPAAVRPRKPPKTPRAEEILLGLWETVIDRVADLLEVTAVDLDHAGTDIFQTSEQRAPIANARYKDMLRQIGRCADLASRTREGLATFDRALPFVQLAFDRRKAPKELKTRIKAMARDTQSLNDFAAFLNNKTNFLLDTAVGMISIEQNAIIKIFSVAAVGFMPPTLIASIYGMNFHDMPELDWSYGYPLAIVGMLVSAILPLAFFRYKRWL